MLTALSVIFLGAQCAAAAGYRADLGPMPLDDETKAFIAGRGEATAEIEGDRLIVKGQFRGLPSNATVAHVLLSPAIGVPGRTIFDIDVTAATEGTVNGSIRLTKAQTQALRAGLLYVQIDSEKAPPGYSWGPKGTLWGWLLPDHPRAEQGVPQQGPWFIPQYAVSAR
ncbi:CHRD domain-containing protein [Sphingomonas sp.]|uniref:CHRD domain-containing protein n=1 Tax=Sphingomonas sp. TaxID=28214 RepID=UPI0025D0C28F|nr:CHRD domain-containing protein [Sphingomonas sp.]